MSGRGRPLPIGGEAYNAEQLRFLGDAELQAVAAECMEVAELQHVLPGQHPADVDRALVHADPAFGRVWRELRRRSERDEW